MLALYFSMQGFYSLAKSCCHAFNISCEFLEYLFPYFVDLDFVFYSKIHLGYSGLRFQYYINTLHHILSQNKELKCKHFFLDLMILDYYSKIITFSLNFDLLWTI